MENIKENIIQIIGQENLLENEPLKNHTSFKIGGPAKYMAFPKNDEMLGRLLKYLKENALSYYIMGNGSNILASDEGYDGIVVMVNRNLASVRCEGNKIYAGAGSLLSAIANCAYESSLCGFEFASGIPGTLGGACAMNAGAYGGEMKDVLESVNIIDEQCELKTLKASELELGYRTSIIQKKDYIVVSAVIVLEKGNKAEIKNIMDDLAARRREKQPLNFPSAGSTFKRPEGYFAGKLISDAGLKGFSIGGAQVSEKHAGFVVNIGGATAKDVYELIKYVKCVVLEQFGVELEPEVRFLGKFED